MKTVNGRQWHSKGVLRPEAKTIFAPLHTEKFVINQQKFYQQCALTHLPPLAPSYYATDEQSKLQTVSESRPVASYNTAHHTIIWQKQIRIRFHSIFAFQLQS